MIFQTIDYDHLVSVVLDYTGNVCIQLVFPAFVYKGPPVFYRENGMDMDLGIRVCHILNYQSLRN